MVKKKLLHEIILRFGLPRSLQSDNGTSFTSKVTQGVSKALGITYYFHCAWRPQSSGKVERANQFLKSVIKKITQESSPGMEGGFTISSPPYPYSEKAMATHSSILAWEIPWMEELGRLPSMGSRRVGHD